MSNAGSVWYLGVFFLNMPLCIHTIYQVELSHSEDLLSATWYVSVSEVMHVCL